jgi:hypothetical protein
MRWGFRERIAIHRHLNREDLAHRSTALQKDSSIQYFSARFYLALNLDSAHRCAETTFIIPEISLAKSDSSVFLLKDRRPPALSYPLGHVGSGSSDMRRPVLIHHEVPILSIWWPPLLSAPTLRMRCMRICISEAREERLFLCCSIPTRLRRNEYKSLGVRS